MWRMTAPRRFLFLQGPHGPFFARLGKGLRAAGAEVWRVGFNQGDRVFWRGPGYIAFDGASEDWPDACAALLDRHQITDLVLYGDTRPIHAKAILAARARGLTVHVFEEGYLRPYWVTYERGGSNGHSQLMGLTIEEMRAALARPGADHPPAPARWGDMREHVFYGALYHFFVLAMNGRYPRFRPHRAIGVATEFQLHLRRLLLMPWHRLERRLATRPIRRGAFPYHLVLLQLEHDASFRAHSDLPSMADFIALCLKGFAEGAAPHHHLVFKAHPLEDGRVPLRRLIAEGAARAGLRGRVHFLRGGKLAPILDGAASAVTVNSTAAQQALYRGLPVKIFGRAIYDKPEFVSRQPLAAFFAAPEPPDSAAYRDFRQFLLESSQIPGGFYSARGRSALLRRIVDLLLATDDPTTTILLPKAARGQQLRVVSTGR